jgi:hypothetical protein
MGGEGKMHGSDEKFTTQFYLEHLSGVGNIHCLGVGEKFVDIYKHLLCRCVPNSSVSRLDLLADSCDHGNEISGCEQGGKFTLWETICFPRKT